MVPTWDLGSMVHVVLIAPRSECDQRSFHIFFRENFLEFSICWCFFRRESRFWDFAQHILPLSVHLSQNPCIELRDS